MRNTMTTNTTTPLATVTETPTEHGLQEPDSGQHHPFGRTIAEDLALLQAGEETLWRDETGTPAPWPQDFLDPAAGWTDGNDLHEPDQDNPPATTGAPAPF
jgi:hypothetical protein